MNRGTGAGLFNPVHPWTVQVLGEAGAAYLSQLKPAARTRLPRKLAGLGMNGLIVAGGSSLADSRAWVGAGIDVQYNERPAHEVVHALRCEQAEAGRHAVLHGVFLEVHGIGLLLEGPPGVGKSALALELLGRGHALVADDAVEFRRPAPGVLVGRAPGVIEGFLETRALGVLDVRRLHGNRALRNRARLELIVKLSPGKPRAPKARELLEGRRSTRRVLGDAVPVLALSAGARQSLATLVEAACLDRCLRLDGVDAPAALERRQARAIRKAR